MTSLKRLAARLPERWQYEMRRVHYGREVVRGTFRTPEYEYELLPHLARPGDWAIDIGANLGHYTRRLSDLVGISGRVIALEPVPTTFALLAADVQSLTNANVTLTNAAASDRLGVIGMSVPRLSTGLANYYGARVALIVESRSADVVATLSALGYEATRSGNSPNVVFTPRRESLRPLS